eukprot:gene11575-2105_t
MAAIQHDNAEDGDMALPTHPALPEAAEFPDAPPLSRPPELIDFLLK